MTRAANLNGRKFHKLSVKKRGPNTKGGQTQWYCDCDCGNENILVRGVLLTSKTRPTKSCGCHQKERAAEAQFTDLTGQKFGRLKALSLAGKNKFDQYLYKCECDCGNHVTVIGARLTAPEGYGTRSCGCIQKERASEANKVDLTDETFGRLKCIRPLGTSGDNGIIWECSCSCGNTAQVPAKYLTLEEGSTQSCGCISAERDFRISYEGFKTDTENAKRPWYIYLAEVACIVDKIGIAKSLKVRARTGEYSNYWWSKQMKYVEAWAVEKVALKATEHYLPEEPYFSKHSGPTEQRTGWVIEETIELMDSLTEECQRDGWQLFYEKHFPHVLEDVSTE